MRTFGGTKSGRQRNALIKTCPKSERQSSDADATALQSKKITQIKLKKKEQRNAPLANLWNLLEEI
jgi:hypothetical protein